MKKQKYFLQGAIVVFTFFSLPCSLLIDLERKAVDKQFYFVNSSNKVGAINKNMQTKDGADRFVNPENNLSSSYLPFPLIGPCLVFITPIEK